ncbi:MAG: zinc ribbon domain-containing protein [Methanobacteriaceae archaeon]|nr:zinc ribbon domain-containing protein [Methanobacteriaceae archaeon]
MKFEDMTFCQSCSMPLQPDVLGTNSDGSKNEEYCMYCFKDGEFVADMSMDEMINFCVKPMVENNDMDETEAREILEEVIPQLKRWRK